MDEARSIGLEALHLFQAGDNATGIGITLSDFAFLAAWDGRYEDAVRLSAAAGRVKEAVGGPPGGFAGILDGDPADEAAAHLSEDVIGRAREEGAALTIEEAVRLAEREAEVQPSA